MISGRILSTRILESFVVAVRNLLIPIFCDIDRFGAKSTTPKKAPEEVTRFYERNVFGPETRGDRKRPAGSDSCLITGFNVYVPRNGGVPWNNNLLQSERSGTWRFNGKFPDHSSPQARNDIFDCWALHRLVVSKTNPSCASSFQELMTWTFTRRPTSAGPQSSHWPTERLTSGRARVEMIFQLALFIAKPLVSLRFS